MCKIKTFYKQHQKLDDYILHNGGIKYAIRSSHGMFLYHCWTSGGSINDNTLMKQSMSSLLYGNILKLTNTFH